MTVSQDWTWTDERIDSLRALAAAGRSMSDMAAELSAQFSCSVSRSAVIGKIHRLGIKTLRRKNQYEDRPVKKRARRQRVSPITIRRIVVAKRTFRQIEEEYRAADRIGVDLLDLGHGLCRWPLGGLMEPPPHKFCGRPALKGRPYCEYHEEINRRKEGR